MDELLTAKQVAAILKCSSSMVYKMREQGILPATHKLFPGQKGFRWTKTSVEDYIERCKIGLPMGYNLELKTGLGKPIVVPTLREILGAEAWKRVKERGKKGKETDL